MGRPEWWSRPAVECPLAGGLGRRAARGRLALFPGGGCVGPSAALCSLLACLRWQPAAVASQVWVHSLSPWQPAASGGGFGGIAARRGGGIGGRGILAGLARLRVEPARPPTPTAAGGWCSSQLRGPGGDSAPCGVGAGGMACLPCAAPRDPPALLMVQPPCMPGCSQSRRRRAPCMPSQGGCRARTGCIWGWGVWLGTGVAPEAPPVARAALQRGEATPFRRRAPCQRSSAQPGAWRHCCGGGAR